MEKNKTFRALLNLLLKKIKIPPVNIEESEKNIYKDALLKAIMEQNYSPITHFYYYKICDAIISLDIDNIKEKEEFKR